MFKLTEQDIKWYNKRQYKGKAKLFYHVKTVRIKNKELSFYEFVIEYLIDIFNKPDSPWQDGFWKWMEKTGNGKSYYDGYIDIGKPSNNKWNTVLSSVPIEYFPKQMLTGYILEYLEDDEDRI